MLLRDNFVLDLLIGRTREDFPLHQLILSSVGPALDNLLGIVIANRWGAVSWSAVVVLMVMVSTQSVSQIDPPSQEPES